MGSTWWDRFCSWVLSWWPLVWRSDHERECQQLTDELHVCNALFTTRGVLTHKHLKAALARLRDSLPANVAWSDVSDSLAAVGLAPLERLLEAEAKITGLVSGASCAGLCPLDWYASRAMVVEEPALCDRVHGQPCGRDKIEACWRKFADAWMKTFCVRHVAPTEGQADAAIATPRMAEIEAHPELVVRGPELDSKLKQWENEKE